MSSDVVYTSETPAPRPLTLATWAPSRPCRNTTPEPHLLGEFPMDCYPCHIEADS